MQFQAKNMYQNILVIFIFASGALLYVTSLECYICRSDADHQCATQPGMQIDVTTCKDTDKCATAIFSDGSTRRGCLSDIFPNNYCPEKTCHSCNTSLCNVIVFPTDRRKCYQCSGSACMDVDKTKLIARPCPIFVENDRCFTNIISDKNIVRGCVSKNIEKCDNICLKCNYDKCNNEKGVFNSTCYSCQYFGSGPTASRDYACERQQHYDDEKNQRCVVSGLKNCTQKVLLGHKAKCFVHYAPSTDTVTRGCTTNSGLLPQGIRKECYGDFCNTDCVDMKCNSCDSKTDPNCRSKLKYTHEKKCPENTFSCFSCEDKDGLVERGCGFQETLQNSRKCYHCYDANSCNKNITRTCYHCTSTQDPNCQSWNDITKIRHELCKNPDELCVSTKTDKYIVRGCSSSTIECTEGDPICRRCNGSLCNGGQF